MKSTPSPLTGQVLNSSAENISIYVTTENLSPQEEPIDAGCATAYAPYVANSDNNCQTALKPVDLDDCQTAIKPVVLDDDCQTAIKPVSVVNDDDCQTAMKPISMSNDTDCQTAMRPVFNIEPLDAGTTTACKPISSDDANCYTAMKPVSTNSGLVPVIFGTPAYSNDDPGKSMLTAQSGQFYDTTPTAMLPILNNKASKMTAAAVQIVNDSEMSTATAVKGNLRGKTTATTTLGNQPTTASAITAIGSTPTPADAAYFGMK